MSLIFLKKAGEAQLSPPYSRYKHIHIYKIYSTSPWIGSIMTPAIGVLFVFIIRENYIYIRDVEEGIVLPHRYNVLLLQHFPFRI